MKNESSAVQFSQIKKVKLQYSVGNSRLLLFSAPFIVWQMGVLYFSGTTMSLFGRTPIPLAQEDTTAVIAAGYIISMLLLALFPRKAVLMERIAMPLALAATVLMMFPFPPAVVTKLFFVSAFVCVFSIGTMCSIAAQHFTVETTWRDGIISMTVGGILIAVLQNDLFNISFTVFTVFSVFLIVAQTVFYYTIPLKIEAEYVSRDNEVKMPKILFLGIWLISGFSTLLICLASSFAESVRGGVSVLYLSASVMAVILFLLRKRFGSGSLRIFGCFFALAVFGFVLSFLSIYIHGLQIIACVLLGFIVVLANLWLFFAAASFRVYPTRFIGVIGAAIGFVLVAFHSGLLEALRNDTALLYGIYAVLSVGLLLIYFFMEPYFLRMWNKEYAIRANELLPLNEETAAVSNAKAKAAPQFFGVLSEQERILAGLILDGYTETSASRIMNISINTQKSYRKNIYFKLDIHSKRELFELANKE